MRVWLRRKRIGATLVGVLLVAACSTNWSTPATPTLSATPTAAGLVPVTVRVDPDLAQPPFDEPRQALVPAGWTLSVWARVPEARLAAWAPDGRLLVSVPTPMAASWTVRHCRPSNRVSAHTPRRSA